MSELKFKINTKHSVRGKLLAAILITSSAVTLVLTGIQLAADYRSDLSYIQKRMNEIRVGRSGTLSQALWQLDSTLLETGLEGLLSVQDVIYAEISDQPNEKTEVGTATYKRGKYVPSQAIVFTEPLYHTVESNEETATLKTGQKIHLGNLNVVFTKNLIYERLQNKAILIMGTQAIKTFVVSFLILIFIRSLIIQHLSTMATYFQNFEINNLNEPLKLNKRPYKGNSTEDRRDEFDLVVESINKMIQKVKENYDLQKKHQEDLSQMNASLDRRVKEQTQQLADEKQQMTILLDNMSQAVFRVGAERKVVAPISKHSAEIFGDNLEGKEIFDLIYNKSEIDPASKAMVAEVFSMCFGEDSLQWELNEHNLPPKLRIVDSDKTLRMSYSPLFSDADQLNQILFVIEDITKMQKLEELRIKSSRQIAIMQAFASVTKQDIIAFFESVERQLSAVDKLFNHNIDEASLVACYRDLHTLKGNSRMLNFDDMAQATHLLESEISEALAVLRSQNELDASKKDALKAKLGDIYNFAHEAADIGGKFFAMNLPLATQANTTKSQMQTIEVLKSGYDNLKNSIRLILSKNKMPDIIEVNRAFEELTFTDLQSGFEKLKPMVNEISTRLGKSVELGMSGPSTSISPAHIEKVLEIAMHVVRNGLDHGLESAEVRKNSGKEPTGKIKIAWTPQENDLFLTISDDGKGIDKEKIRKKAIEIGLLKATDQKTEAELINLIFAPTLSTADQVSDISGRGVGMDAVANAVKDLGGSIEVESKLGIGTTFKVHLKIRTKVSPTETNFQAAA